MSDLACAARGAVLALAALAVLAACGDPGDGGVAQPTPAPAAESAEAPAAEKKSSLLGPEVVQAAVGSHLKGDPFRGAAHYGVLCASCHGEKGCGDGPLAASLRTKPANHCDGVVMNELEDEYLFRIIKEGGAAVNKSPLMAPWGGTLDDAQIRDVVAYVRSLANPPYRPRS
jgi:cytochrome c oxidase cbb3-type subunit 3